MVGERFGECVVVEVFQRPGGRMAWRCRWVCDCGASGVTRFRAVLSWAKRPCQGRHRVYQRDGHDTIEPIAGASSSDRVRWRMMINRCHNPRSRDWDSYGGRGIVVCDEWRGPGGFRAFLGHVGQSPGPGYSIDRIDNDRGYEPGNVKWATAKEQQRNKRTTPTVTANGESLSVAEWAERLGVHKSSIQNRLANGWTPERAVSQPPRCPTADLATEAAS